MAQSVRIQPLNPRRLDVYHWYQQGRPEEDIKPGQSSMQPCILIYDCPECHLFLPYYNTPHLCVFDEDQDEGFAEREDFFVAFATDIYNLIADPAQPIWVLRLDDACWCGECFKTLTLDDVV